MTDAVELENVSVARNGVQILSDITATIPHGGVTAIIGPNGAGKTTLLHAILDLIPSEGRIRLRSRSGKNRPTIGYVPQRLDFDRGSPITVLDFLVMGNQRLPVWFGARKKHRDRAVRHLERVQAAHLLKRPLGKLSGGELQRVQLALALQMEPEIVLLDEPVSGVDVSGERLFCDMLEQVQQESHLTLVMVSHDLSVVSRHSTNVICLKDGRLHCEGPTPVALNTRNLAVLYGPHAGLYDQHQHAPGEPVGHEHHHATGVSCGKPG